MIKLFVTDLDGCISFPFQTPPWDVLTEIRYLNQQSEFNPEIPPLTICSGRPQPYVEAVAQWLSVRKPVVFESGGMYDPSTNRLFMNGVFDEKAEKQIWELKSWLEESVLSEYPSGMLEFTKKMDAGFVAPEKEVIDEVLPLIEDHVGKNYPDFEVHFTDISINVILKTNNKEAGIRRLCEHLNLTPEEVAYIGDSGGDIPALNIVGRPFAPANANSAVREISETLPDKATRAVLEAYKRLIEANRRKG
jgi:HAD superfamily hydrolase (TIGR01484 family)